MATVPLHFILQNYVALSKKWSGSELHIMDENTVVRGSDGRKKCAKFQPGEETWPEESRTRECAKGLWCHNIPQTPVFNLPISLYSGINEQGTFHLSQGRSINYSCNLFTFSVFNQHGDPVRCCSPSVLPFQELFFLPLLDFVESPSMTNMRLSIFLCSPLRVNAWQLLW